MNDRDVRALATLLGVNFVNFGGRAQVEHVSQELWASVTFCGGRHNLRITLEGPGAVGAAADFLATMPELDLPVPGHVIADLALLAEARSDDGRYACLDLEALTIEDP